MQMSKKQLIEVEGRELAISNVDKVYFPESGFTKGEVIAFYSEIAEVILPHLRDRPLTLKRFPEGINGEYFYEKNAPKHTPLWVQRFAVPRSEDGARINYVLCNARATLVWVTNLGDIEKHVLLAKAPPKDCRARSAAWCDKPSSRSPRCCGRSRRRPPRHPPPAGSAPA